MPTHNHALEENVKIIIHGADCLIDLEIELNPPLLPVVAQIRSRHRIIDAVMNVKAGRVLRPHPAPAHIRLVRDDERRRNRIERVSRRLIVIRDGGDDFDTVLHREILAPQNLIGQERSVLRVMLPVQRIADVVQKPGDFHQLDIVF